MCDAFPVLAQTEGGLCLLMPRFKPDGDRNPIHIQRLKDKLGNRSNASSEVEVRGAWARPIGEEEQTRTIIEMVNTPALDPDVTRSGSAIRREDAEEDHRARQ